MPIVVVYDSADTLDFGTAYISDDACESPLSVLTFGGATVEAATRREFEAFRRTQPNLVTRESYWSRAPDDVLKRMNIGRAPAIWAHVCEGYKRFRIPDNARAGVQEHWPESHPEYWITGTYEAARQPNVFGNGFTQPIQTDREGDDRHPLTAFNWPGDDAADFGAMRRAPTPGGALAASYYPSSDDYRFDKWPRDRKEWPEYIAAQRTLADVTISFGNTQARGLAYCFVRVFPGSDLLNRNDSRRIAARVDSYDVPYPEEKLGGPPRETPMLIFERDEYVFQFFRFYLESTRGDV